MRAVATTIRPLLHCLRASGRFSRRGETWREDITNEDVSICAIIRHELMPVLSGIAPGGFALARLAALAPDDEGGLMRTATDFGPSIVLSNEAATDAAFGS